MIVISKLIHSSVGKRKVWENANGKCNATCVDLCSKFPRVNTK